MSDKWALQYFASTADVGYYGVLYQLGYTPLTLLTSIMVTYLAPLIFKKHSISNNGHNKNIALTIAWKAAFLMIALALFMTILTYLFYPVIYRLLVSGEFFSSSFLLPWVLLAGGLFAAGQIISLNILSNLSPGLMLKPKVMLSIIGIIINIIAAKYYGLTGVIFAINIYSLIYLFWMSYLAYTIQKINKLE